MYLMLLDYNFIASDDFQELLQGIPDDQDIVTCITVGTLVKLAERVEPQIIVVDFALAGDEGTELFARLRRRAPQVYILGLVGPGHFEELYSAIDEGGLDDYIVMPPSAADFLARLHIGLTRAASRAGAEKRPDARETEAGEAGLPSLHEEAPGAAPESVPPASLPGEEELYFAADELTGSPEGEENLLPGMETAATPGEERVEKAAQGPEDSTPPGDFPEEPWDLGPGTGAATAGEITRDEPVPEDDDSELFSPSFAPGEEGEGGGEDTFQPAEFDFFEEEAPSPASPPPPAGPPPAEQPSSVEEKWDLPPLDFVFDDDSSLAAPESPEGTGAAQVSQEAFSSSAFSPPESTEPFTPAPPPPAAAGEEPEREAGLFYQPPSPGEESISHLSEPPPAAAAEPSAFTDSPGPASLPPTEAAGESYFDDLFTDDSPDPAPESAFPESVTEASWQDPYHTAPPGREASLDQTGIEEDLFDSGGFLSEPETVPAAPQASYADMGVYAEEAEEEEEETRRPRKKRSARGGFFKRFFSVLGNVFFALLLLMMATLSFYLIQSRITGDAPSVAGYQVYIVLSGSMAPAFDTGSLAFVRDVEAEEIAVGDIITFRGTREGGALTTHRVMEVRRDAGLYFVTRGDANQVNDPSPVPAENVVGRVTGSVPYLGYIFDFVQTRQGLVLLIFIPGLLIILYEMSKIVRQLSERNSDKRSEKRGRREEEGWADENW